MFSQNTHLIHLNFWFKGQGASEKDTSVLHKQLMLALTWNRSDIAEEQIFNKDINWPEGEKDLNHINKR